jgi:hypothetical protein
MITVFMKRERDGTIQALEERISRVLAGVPFDFESYLRTHVLHFRDQEHEKEALRRLQEDGLNPCPERPRQPAQPRPLTIDDINRKIDQEYDMAGLARLDGDLEDSNRRLKKIEQLRELKRGL